MSLSETPSQQTDSLAGEFPPDFFQEKCGVNVAGSTYECFLLCCAAALLIAPSGQPRCGHPPAARCPRTSPLRAEQDPRARWPSLRACPRSARSEERRVGKECRS